MCHGPNGSGSLVEAIRESLPRPPALIMSSSMPRLCKPLAASFVAVARILHIPFGYRANLCPKKEQKMRVREAMTKSVATIQLNTTLREAAEKMRAEDVGALPVVDPQADKIKGMLTDRDIVIRAAAIGRDLGNTFAREAMTEKIRFVFEDDDISKAAEFMQDKQVRRLVVLNREKRLVGMISLADLALKSQDEHLSAGVMKKVSQGGRRQPGAQCTEGAK